MSGCGPAGSGPSGTGGTGGSAAASTPSGAVAVSFVAQDAASCPISSHGALIGDVSADAKSQLVEDGATAGNFTVSATCDVAASGADFKVSGTLASGATSITLSVAALSPGATKDKPATGAVSYQSQNTGQAFSQSDCHFYFSPGQSVSAGKVWVTFECDQIAASADKVCSLGESYAAFEGCTTGG